MAEQRARAAAEEAELLRRVISQLPRPIMSSRTETSITLSLARLIKSSGDDKVLNPPCRWTGLFRYKLLGESFHIDSTFRRGTMNGPLKRLL